MMFSTSSWWDDQANSMERVVGDKGDKARRFVKLKAARAVIRRAVRRLQSLRFDTVR